MSLAGLEALILNGCQQEPGKPNILIFLADDLGYGDLGCYGNPINQTPHIDRLASQGMQFTDFHSAGTVCSPSRASLLTGRHPYRMGFYYILGGGAHLRSSEITIASLLRDAGYDTCFTGKWHLTDFENPQNHQPTPYDHGFDHWFATVLNAFDGPESPGKFYRNGQPVGELNGWYCDLIVEEAMQWLQSREDPQKPFFLMVASHEPHTPINPPASFSDRFDSKKVDSLEKNIGYGYVPRPDPEEKNIEENKKQYYGTVAQLDAAVGKLINKVDQLGHKENTMIIFTSDNGPEYPVNLLESKGEWDDPIRDNCFGSPGPLRGMKRFTYEGGHRVPGIVRWPASVPAGMKSDALINGTDFLPTLCTLAGIVPPADRTIDGENVLSAFKGQSYQRAQPVAWSAPVHEYEFIPPMTYRDGQYLLVAWFTPKNPEELWMTWLKKASPERYELYDLSTDISESHDLATKMPGKVQSLSVGMNRLWSDIQKEAPVWPAWKAK